MKIRSLSAAVLVLTLSCSGGSNDSPLGENEVAVTAVGTTQGSPVEALVPTTGASLQSADGRLLVEIPDGAIATAQTLSIQAISNEGPGGVGAAYRLGPDGTTFAKPVKLTFAYDEEDLVGSEAVGLQVAYQDAQGQWNALKASTLDDVNGKITVETTHFSDWSLLEGFQLRPGRATVRGGQQVDFEVKVCSNLVAGADDLAELRFICRSDPDFFTGQEWAVNGVTHGNSSVGKLSGETDTTATYTAPGSAPANNPVTISVAATDKTSKRKVVLTAIVLFDEHPPLVGTVNATHEESDLGLVLKTTADVTFKWSETNGGLYRPDPSSTLTANWDIVGGDCETHGTFTKHLSANDGTVIVFELGYFPAGAATGTFTGTTRCGETTEPFELTMEVEWWPTPVDAILSVKPDGKFADSFVDQVLGSGALVSADWTLTPSTD